MSGKPRENTKGKTGPQTRDVNAAQRAQLALQLRAQRIGYDEIARRCGFASRGAAHNAVMRELGRVVSPDVERVRKEEAHSLDVLEAKCWERLDSEDHEKAMLFAVDRILQIKERRAKLLGLDTPVRDAANANLLVIREVPAGLLPQVVEGKP